MRVKSLLIYILSVHCWTALTAKFCPGLQKSEGVKIMCKSPDGQKMNCTDNAVPGSTAILTCLPYYMNDRESVSMNCRPSGNWFPYRSFQCDIDCGRREQLVQPLIAHGYLTDTIKWPWHVAIFRKTVNKNNETYEYICGGSILTSSTILTAAHCLTPASSSSSSKSVSPNLFKVVLGSVSSDYDTNSLIDSPAKVFSVNALTYHADYNPLTFEADIAILQLSRRITFDNKIRPVCYPRGQGKSLRLASHHLNIGNSGYVVGYGLEENRELSKVLKETQLPIVSTGVCAESLGITHAHSQFCAGYSNGTAVCSGDSGGGMYFPFESNSDTGTTTRYMVQGIVSYAKRGKCDSFSVFTRVTNFADWLEQEQAKFAESRFSPSELDSNSPANKKCEQFEIPLNVQVECYQDSSLHATKISCSEGRMDAVAKFSCAKNYMQKMTERSEPSDGDGGGQHNLATCLPTGQWTPVDIQCEPECGLATTSKGDKDAPVVVEPVPWHARIYGIRRGVNGTKSQLTQLCSGSLIETSFIVTSAGCITGSTGSLLPLRHFKIVLGTNSSNHLTDFRSPNIQIFDVKKMWIPHTFVKSERTSDIALVQLQGSAELTDHVKRVCYLREYQEDIVFGSWGKSVNFLKTVENKEFDTVRHAIFFSGAECNTVEMNVPLRSFCSPVKRGEVVCKNDTGHGLTQQLNSQLHVLKGVLSHVGSMASDPRPCLVASYVAYTQVEAFGAWLLEIISSANSSQSS